MLADATFTVQTPESSNTDIQSLDDNVTQPTGAECSFKDVRPGKNQMYGILGRNAHIITFPT